MTPPPGGRAFWRVACAQVAFIVYCVWCRQVLRARLGFIADITTVWLDCGAWTCCTICALVQEARLVDQINATVVSCAPKSGVALVRHVGDDRRQQQQDAATTTVPQLQSGTMLTFGNERGNVVTTTQPAV